MRKLLTLLIISVFTIILAVYLNRSRKPECETELAAFPRTYITTAFDLEAKAVLEYFNTIQICRAKSGIEYALLSDKDTGFQVVYYSTGVGPQKAISSTTKTIESMKVKELFFSGIAGRINNAIKGSDAENKLNIGDTVIVKTWYSNGKNAYASVDDTLLLKAVNTKGAYLLESGITSEDFITDSGDIMKYPSQYGSLIIDMESYYIASIAGLQKIPFLSIRSISDNADGTESRKDFNIAARASATFLDKLLEAHFKPSTFN